MITKPTQPLFVNYLPEDRECLRLMKDLVKEKTGRTRGETYLTRFAVRVVSADPKLIRRLLKQVKSEPVKAVVE